MKQPKTPTRAAKIAGGKRHRYTWESFESPDSTNILGAKYCAATYELLVVFKPKDAQPPRVYSYTIPVRVWQGFRDEALSKGTYFQNVIKPSYVGVACVR